MDLASLLIGFLVGLSIGVFAACEYLVEENDDAYDERCE